MMMLMLTATLIPASAFAGETISWQMPTSSFMYDGKAHTPSVKVLKKSSGAVLYSKYYLLSGIETATKPGTYTLNIKLRNGYSGSSSRTWKITLGTPSRPGVKINGNKATCTTTFKYCDRGDIYIYKKNGSRYQMMNYSKYMKNYKNCSGQKTVTFKFPKGTYHFWVAASAGSARTCNCSPDFVIY